jgi:geranylgeranyl reductase family protein
MFRCDVLVVGAGPAGSSAASEASRCGAKVLVVEKKKIIGQPVQCAEFVPKLLWKETGVGRESVAQEIKEMKVYLPDGECRTSNSPGYVLNRSIFDKRLAIEAANRGADISTDTLCLSKRRGTVIIKRDGKEMEVNACVIIGADGPKSTVGRWVKSANKDFVSALQYEIPLTAPLDSTEVYFDPEIRGGYAWLFPKGRSANVGVGMRYGSKLHPTTLLKKLLSNFVDKLVSTGKIKRSPISVTGGLIPVGGPLSTVRENVMLVGDAAGQTHSITGSGIPQAVICGRVAGTIAAKAVRLGRLDVLGEYEEEWSRIFGDELKRAWEKRQMLESHWDELDRVLKSCWVTFREYYE